MTSVIRYDRVVGAICAVIFCFMIVRYGLTAPRKKYSDFRVYHATAKAFLERKDIYRLEGRSLTPFKYSPFFAFAISPLGLMPIESAGLIFFTVNFISILLIAAFSYRLIVPVKIPFRETWLIGAVAVLTSVRFILGILDAGQVNGLMLALVLGAITAERKKRDFTCGCLLGASVMIKYVSFLFVPYYLARGKIRPACMTLMMIGVYCLLPATIVGISQQQKYLERWIPTITQNSLDRGSWTDHKNQSLGSLAVRTLIKDSPYKEMLPSMEVTDYRGALAAAGVLIIILYGLILWRPVPSRFGDLIDYGLLFLGMALFNANAWPFNFIVFLFVSMVIVYGLMRVRPLRGGASFLFLLSFILANIGSESLGGNAVQHWTEVYSFLTWSALILWGVLVRWKFDRRLSEIP